MTTELIAAIVALRVAYLAIGFGLCLIGRSLIERGVSANFEGQGAITSMRFKVVTASPGLVFGVAGLAVIALAIFRQAELPLGPLESASTARFGTEGEAAPVETALREGHPDKAGAALLALWRSDPLKIAPSLDDPKLRLAIAPAIELALAREQPTSAPVGSQVTFDSVRARLYMTLQTTPALKTHVGDASTELAQLDAARRTGDATSIARLLVAAFNRNPAALYDVLKQTRANDWPAASGMFLPLRDELIRVAAP